jgi:hypothetical protein
MPGSSIDGNSILLTLLIHNLVGLQNPHKKRMKYSEDENIIFMNRHMHFDSRIIKDHLKNQTYHPSIFYYQIDF